jgi:YD repeat-containing protein
VTLNGAPGVSTWSYDNDSLITCVSAGACTPGNARIEYTLDPSLPRIGSSTTYAPTGETLAEQYTYNEYGQVETYAITAAQTSFTLAYSYDALGRIVTVAETSGGAVQPTKAYEYDALGRPRRRSEAVGYCRIAAARWTFMAGT